MSMWGKSFFDGYMGVVIKGIICGSMGHPKRPRFIVQKDGSYGVKPLCNCEYENAG
jgi:hypothetical protein